MDEEMLAGPGAVPVYIKDKNSGLVLEYRDDSTYEVVIEQKKDGDRKQQWILTNSGVIGYVYILNKKDKRKVITASDKAQTPLYLTSKSSSLDKSQLWILRAPDNGTNPYFVLMSANTGLVMDVVDGITDPGTHVQVYKNHSGPMQQFSFEQ